MACHTCDNRSCVNPAHLFLGTASDNVADMVAKGRGVRGSKHPLAKLTESEAAFIRESTDARLALAKQFNVDAAIIDRIRQGKSWKHVA